MGRGRRRAKHRAKRSPEQPDGEHSEPARPNKKAHLLCKRWAFYCLTKLYHLILACRADGQASGCRTLDGEEVVLDFATLDGAIRCHIIGITEAHTEAK